MPLTIHRLVILLFLHIIILTGCGTLPPAPPIADEGVHQLEDLARREPDNPDHHFALAITYHKIFNAISHPDYLERVITEARETLRLQPQHGPASGILGQALITKGLASGDEQLVREGVSSYKRASEMSPQLAEDNSFPPVQFMEAVIHMAKVEKQPSAMEEASKALKEAIRTKPGHPDSHAFLASIYVQQKNWDLALHEYQEASRLTPDKAEYLRAIVEVKLELIESSADLAAASIDSSIAVAQEALQKEPGHPFAHLLLGRLFGHKGQFDLAIFETKEALRLVDNAAEKLPPDLRGGPGDTYGRSSLRGAAVGIHEALGNSYSAMGDYEAAEGSYRTAMQLLPRYGWAHGGMGYVYYLQQRYQEAARQFETFFEMEESGSPTLAIFYAHCLTQTNEDDKGRQLLTKLRERGGYDALHNGILDFYLEKISAESLQVMAKNRRHDAEVAFYLGVKALAQGRQEDARTQFERATASRFFLLYEHNAAQSLLKHLAAQNKGALKASAAAED